MRAVTVARTAILVPIVVIGCGSPTFSQLTKGAPSENPEVSPFMLQLTVAEGTNAVFKPELEFILTIVNKSESEINLDPRLLSPSIITSLSDDRGSLIPKVPPPFPKALRADRIVVLKAKGQIERKFQLFQITMEEMVSTSWKVVCCYNNSSHHYETAMRIWQGKVCSNPVIILPNLQPGKTGNGVKR